MEMAHHRQKGIIHRLKFPQQSAAHLSGGVGGSVSGLGFNQINDSLRRCKVHASVEKRPLGELAGGSLPGSLPEQMRQCLRQYSRGAVALQFHRVLPGVAARSRCTHSEDPIDHPPLSVMKVIEAKLPGNRFRQRGAVNRGQDSSRKLGAIRPGQTNHADPGGNRRGGDGGDDIRHGSSSFRIVVDNGGLWKHLRYYKRFYKPQFQY